MWIRELFDELDADGGGSLDTDELRQVPSFTFTFTDELKQVPSFTLHGRA